MIWWIDPLISIPRLPIPSATSTSSLGLRCAGPTMMTVMMMALLSRLHADFS